MVDMACQEIIIETMKAVACLDAPLLGGAADVGGSRMQRQGLSLLFPSSLTLRFMEHI